MEKDESDRILMLTAAGHIDEAKEILSAILLKDVNDHNAYFILGQILLLEGNLTEAAQKFQAAITQKNEPVYVLHLAKALRMAQRLEDSCGIYAHLVSRYPHVQNLRWDLETVLMETRVAKELSDQLGQAAVLQEMMRKTPPAIAPTIGFETKVWEGDWRLILTSGRLERMIDLCCLPFNERTVVINNVADRTAVKRAADALVARGVLTRYVDVEEEAEAALAHFNLSTADLGSGYIYSIAELVGLFTCRTEYLAHFSGDSILQTAVDWITPSIQALSADRRFVVANPVWGPSAFGGLVGARDASSEAIAETPDFCIGFGFSDQCYLVHAPLFKGDLYRMEHYEGRRYPAYGGPLFEKRVDAWMRTNGRLRLTYKQASYLHQNIRENTLEAK